MARSETLRRALCRSSWIRRWSRASSIDIYPLCEFIIVILIIIAIFLTILAL
jgi:hypothetical protein